MVSDELRTRIITAAIAGSIVILCWALGVTSWVLLCVLAGMVCVLEWHALSEEFSPKLRHAGLAYLACCISAAILLRYLPTGQWWIAFGVLSVVATDTLAYFGGKRFGKHALAPSISPNKTIEGLLCGMAGAAGIGLLTSIAHPHLPTLTMMGMGAMLALISQSGDLLVSFMKRRAGVKDSGTLLPGHGGLLDRVDGHLPATLTLYLLLALIGTPQ